MKSGAHNWQRRDARADYERNHAGPNMTPMVDVVMVILIFFMASTVIMGPELLLAAGLASPALADTESDPRFAIEQPEFVITLALTDSGTRVTGLGLVEGSIPEFIGAVRALAADLRGGGIDGPADPDNAGEGDGAIGRVRMIIDPADRVPYEAVIRVQDILGAAGFRSIGLR